MNSSNVFIESLKTNSSFKSYFKNYVLCHIHSNFIPFIEESLSILKPSREQEISASFIKT